MSNNKTYLISVLMLCAVYNAAFFLLKPFGMGAAGWIAYGFTDIAFLMLAFIPFLEPGYSNTGSNMATWLCLAVYTAIVLIVSIFVTAADPVNYKLILVVELLLLCIVSILTMTNLKLNKRSDK